ncbi:MAG: CpsD/CapB family tyrosine-protein kinase [Paracoccus sp. (in: a-proteobacteria)]|jgi:Mrp family chromosome partitioning ATPase|uniref:CpsD/CapB family tyrosine-protein kinase n=1 Tax=Paracoccus sp. TaxID=267 RepID=UPI003257D728|tara:strand:+ start:1442 stop:2308 length:867 start_codon:yes stop_codon:yes gene_type:complete
MEKLQAAIEIARRKRGAAAAAATPRAEAAAAPQPAAVDAGIRTGTVAARAGSGLTALWEALPEAPLDRGALIRSRILSQNASFDSAPFDVLRTKVLYQMRQNGWRRLAITSPLPRSGKTTNAVNLALALGRQPELHSILFDLDLRAPMVADKLGLPTPPSIAPLLRGERDFADHACRVGPNLALALSGSAESDPTRLLMAERSSETLAEIEQRYQPDIMIFDLPSILIGDDARAFLQHVDCALLIARADQTRYGDFDSCEREVGEYTNVLGVVLNGFRHGNGLSDFQE